MICGDLDQSFIVGVSLNKGNISPFCLRIGIFYTGLQCCEHLIVLKCQMYVIHDTNSRYEDLIHFDCGD